MSESMNTEPADTRRRWKPEGTAGPGWKPAVEWYEVTDSGRTHVAVYKPYGQVVIVRSSERQHRTVKGETGRQPGAERP